MATPKDKPTTQQASLSAHNAAVPAPRGAVPQPVPQSVPHAPRPGAPVPHQVPQVGRPTPQTAPQAPQCPTPHPMPQVAAPAPQTAGPAFQEPRPTPAPQEAPQRPTDSPSAAQRVVAAYTAALGRPVLGSTRTRLQQQAAEALAEGLPEAWVTDRARELAANVGKGWTDLAIHIEKSTVPIPGTAPAAPAARPGLPDWCGQCGTEHGSAARHNPRFRVTDDDQPCPDCHPAAVKAAATP